MSIVLQKERRAARSTRSVAVARPPESLLGKILVDPPTELESQKYILF
jgi:hypothetical protein